MDEYITEEQQVEAMKQWWKANGGAILVGVIVGLAVVFGWRYWTVHQASLAEQASLQYAAFSQTAKETNPEQLRQLGKALLEGQPASFYAVLAAFRLARLAVDGGDYGSAVQHLEWVIGHANQDAIKDIARLRLVRVLLAENRSADAEARLAQVTSAHFSAELQELKGDLYLAGNESVKARAAYQAALETGNGSVLLQMKLDNLPTPAAPKE